MVLNENEKYDLENKAYTMFCTLTFIAFEASAKLQSIFGTFRKYFSSIRFLIRGNICKLFICLTFRYVYPFINSGDNNNSC